MKPEVGQQWKNARTGEVVTLTERQEQTTVIYKCESSFGTHPNRTMYFGESEGPRSWEPLPSTQPNPDQTT